MWNHRIGKVPRLLRRPAHWWLGAALLALVSVISLFALTWLRATQARLLRQNGWIIHSLRETSPPANRATHIAVGPNGQVWVGTNSGLRMFDGEIWHSYLATRSGWPTVYALTVDNEGRAWVTSDEGLQVVDVEGQVQTINEGHLSFALATDSSGQVWTAGDWLGGIAPVTLQGIGEGLPGTDPESGLERTRGWALAFGPDGRLWVGTFLEGVSVYNGERWQDYTPVPDLTVRTIAFDPDGQVWGSGDIYQSPCCILARFDAHEWIQYQIPFPGPERASVSALAFDDRGRLWAAFRGKGVDLGLGVYDGATWAFYQTADAIDPLADRPEGSQALVIDPTGHLWVGSGSKLITFDILGGVPATDPVPDAVMNVQRPAYGLAWASGILTVVSAIIAAWATFLHGKWGQNWTRRLQEQALARASLKPSPLEQAIPSAGQWAWAKPESAAPSRRRLVLWWSGVALIGALCACAWCISRWMSLTQAQALQKAGWSIYSLRGTDPPVSIITVIATDRQGRAWLGTNVGLYAVDDTGIYAIDGGKRLGYLGGEAVSDIAVDAEDRVWVNTAIFSYFMDVAGPHEVFHDFSSPAVNPEGEAWGRCDDCDGYLSGLLRTGTYCALEKISISKSECITGPVGHIMAFDPAGRMWVSTGMYEISVYDGRTWERHTVSQPYLIWDIAFDPTGQPWVSGRLPEEIPCCLLAYFDGQQWISQEIPYPQSEGEAVALAFDHQGRLWVTFQPQWDWQSVDIGLAMYDGQSWTFYETADLLDPLLGRGGDVNALHIDAEGRLWISIGPVLAGIDLPQGLPPSDPVPDHILIIRRWSHWLARIGLLATCLTALFAGWVTMSLPVRRRIRPWLIPLLSTIAAMGPYPLLIQPGWSMLRWLSLLEPLAVAAITAWAILTKHPSRRIGAWLAPVVSGAALASYVILFFFAWLMPHSNLAGPGGKPDMEMMRGIWALAGPVFFVIGAVAGLLLYLGGLGIHRRHTPTQLTLGFLGIVTGILLWTGALFVIFVGLGMLATG